MEIYLVRHTTPLIEKGICYGQTDLNITDTFDKEAAIILDKIKTDNEVRIFSSPLKRCVLLAEKFDKHITIDKRLMELDFGDWEMKKWNDIPENEMTPWMQDFVNVKVPKGESYTDLSKRVLDFFHEIKSLNQKQTIIVSHGGPIRSLLAYLTNTELKDSFDIKIIYGQISKIIINETVQVQTSI
jgi:alpha-ribazole phosphatase